jgi:hypothetical protein
VTEAPLWQALDRLLDLYGYDWGYVRDTVVLWPAFTPSRVRAEVPEGEPVPVVPIPADPPPMEVAQPAPAEKLLAARVAERAFYIPTVDPRLRTWKVVGKLGAGDLGRLVRQVADSLCAVVQGPPEQACLCMGAHMWLSTALKGTPELAARLKAQGVTVPTMGPKQGLQPVLIPLLSDQQWELMDLGGRALIWFRELPLEAAEMVVLCLQAGDAKLADPRSGTFDRGALLTDWTYPDEIQVIASWPHQFTSDPETHMYQKGDRQVGLELVTRSVNGGYFGR